MKIDKRFAEEFGMNLPPLTPWWRNWPLMLYWLLVPFLLLIALWRDEGRR